MELVYASACPNIGAARAALRQAFARTGVAACWREGARKAPESPASVRRYGSPALLVNGQSGIPGRMVRLLPGRAFGALRGTRRMNKRAYTRRVDHEWQT